MKKILLLGYGTVGKQIAEVLVDKGFKPDYIVRKTGVYDLDQNKIGERESFLDYINRETTIFISVPNGRNNNELLSEYKGVLEKGGKIVTCEKGIVSHNWNLVDSNKGNIKYTATVGGGSGMLTEIDIFQGKINEILGVINGTLNYVGEMLATGIKEEEIYKNVIKLGYAEPGADSFEEVINNELEDTIQKAVILANHSNIWGRIITRDDINLVGYERGKRCGVILNHSVIEVGFVISENVNWLPKGVQNVLYINSEKVAEGPGAGGRATAERMVADYEDMQKIKS